MEGKRCGVTGGFSAFGLALADLGTQTGIYPATADEVRGISEKI